MGKIVVTTTTRLDNSININLNQTYIFITKNVKCKTGKLFVVEQKYLSNNNSVRWFPFHSYNPYTCQ